MLAIEASASDDGSVSVVAVLTGQVVAARNQAVCQRAAALRRRADPPGVARPRGLWCTPRDTWSRPRAPLRLHRAEGPAVTGERFIPFRRTSIVTMCADEVPAEERDAFRAFTELLASLMHQEFRTRLEALKDTYHPFNPDTETRTIVELGPAERQAAQEHLVDELTALAEDANFERISTDDLGRAFVEESLMKVRLEADFEDFEEVVFYRRGVRTRQEEVRHLFGLRPATTE